MAGSRTGHDRSFCCTILCSRQEAMRWREILDRSEIHLFKYRTANYVRILYLWLEETRLKNQGRNHDIPVNLLLLKHQSPVGLVIAWLLMKAQVILCESSVPAESSLKQIYAYCSISSPPTLCLSTIVREKIHCKTEDAVEYQGRDLCGLDRFETESVLARIAALIVSSAFALFHMRWARLDDKRISGAVQLT